MYDELLVDLYYQFEMKSIEKKSADY